MGNNSSSHDDGGNRSREQNNESNGNESNFFANLPVLRPPSSVFLGLKNDDLAKKCSPSGMYGSCSWDIRTIRRMIGEGKLAPLIKGCDKQKTDHDEECPICFLNYTEGNRTQCCRAFICSECYLQVRPMNDKIAPCPYCNHPGFSIKKSEAILYEEVKERDANEQQKIEAGIRNGLGKLRGDELKDVSRRDRADSLTSSEISDDDIPSTAISVDEREKIEAKMKEQHSHPLVRRMKMEAEEQRLSHDRRYRRTASNRGLRSFLGGRSRHGGGRRNVHQLIRALDESSAEGNEGNMDDLVFFEAALLMSMEQEAARRRMRLESADGTPGTTEASDGNEDGYRSSFSMIHALMARRAAAEAASRSEQENDSEENDGAVARSEPRGRGRFSQRHVNSGIGSEAAATLAMMMRGVSEEEQLNMAIAASLSDAAATAANSSESNENSADENNPRVSDSEAEENSD